MDDQIAIKVDNVSKEFKLPHEKSTSIKGALVNYFHGKRTYERQKVLKDISFEVKKGEFFGIVGRNGSGKSTLLKLLAGIYEPNAGNIIVNGKLTPFIELGVGFNPELTGRENVFLNGALLGFNRKEMLVMYDEIVEFAELEKFMDQKLKNYSSGMQVRLAFSIAIRAKTDILLLDEVLAVGDANFQKKCFDYFRELKKQKRTVVFISHDMNSVREYCDRALLINDGNIVYIGTSDKVAQKYTRLFTGATKNVKSLQEKRWGNKKAVIESVNTKINGDEIIVKIKHQFSDDINNPVFGLTISSPSGIKLFESNTKWKKFRTARYKKNDVAEITWSIPNYFTNGTNTITPAISSFDGFITYDSWEEAGVFVIDKEEVTTAVILPKSNVEIK